jgi:hypothetical protein
LTYDQTKVEKSKEGTLVILKENKGEKDKKDGD